MSKPAEVNIVQAQGGYILQEVLDSRVTPDRPEVFTRFRDLVYRLTMIFGIEEANFTVSIRGQTGNPPRHDGEVALLTRQGNGVRLGK